jgi:hypothetical protein
VRPGGIYYIRSRAGNIIGLGDWSVWSDEILMPETVALVATIVQPTIASNNDNDVSDEDDNDLEGLLPTAPPTDMNIKLPPTSTRK